MAAKSCPYDISFNFVKRINTVPFSIFYSGYANEDPATNAAYPVCAYGRVSYAPYQRRAMHVYMDASFVIQPFGAGEIYEYGEDPRTFKHNGVRYMYDNFLNNMHLYNTQTKEYVALKIDGKNMSFISHNGELYMIHQMRPYRLFKVDVNTGDVSRVSVLPSTAAIHEDYEISNGRYRGGTPGYVFPEDKYEALISPETVCRYYGFGHTTHYENQDTGAETAYEDPRGIMKHHIYMWIIDFSAGPSLDIYEIPQPAGAQNICDPTSVFEYDGKTYLLTAESRLQWFYIQDYITNLYEITITPRA